jgi:outer membrane protein assembly factor BamB
VRRRRTTICCSAIALALLASALGFAQQPSGGTIRLFPTRPAWSLALNSALAAPVGAGGTRAYIPIEGDRLAAYDLTDGRLLWIAAVKPQSQPVVGDGLIFILEPGGLTARRDADGSVAWQLPFPETLAAPLLWDTGWLVAATSSGTVLAFRAVDGELIWRYEPGVRVHARPSFSGDRLYVPLDDSRIVALHADSGVPAWERRLGGPPNEILVIDTRLYVGSNDNFFYCLRTVDGVVDWRWRTGGDVAGMPIADDRRVYFISLDNVVRGLDLHSGAQRWKRALPLRPTRGLVRAGDALLVTGAASKLSAFYLKDGAPAGEITAAGELAAAPIVIETSGLPMVTLITRDLVKGAVVSAVIRSIEPTTGPVAPLPNPVEVPKRLPGSLPDPTPPVVTPK